jgi:hypothetical protein
MSVSHRIRPTSVSLPVALNTAICVGSTILFLIKQTEQFHRSCLLQMHTMSAQVVCKYCLTYGEIINLVCQTEHVRLTYRSITKTVV